MKKLISLLVSLGILAVIYWKLNQNGQLGELGRIFANSDRLWMPVSLAMVVPLTLFTSWRLQQLMPRPGQLSFGEANRLILVASVLNLVLPSKMGDIAKAYFMRDRGGMSGSLALSLVVFEKSCDMLSLLLWCVFGLAWCALDPSIYPHKDALFWIMARACSGCSCSGRCFWVLRGSRISFSAWQRRSRRARRARSLPKLSDSWGEMHAYFWKSKSRLAKVTLTSIFIWFLHLLQIWLFILALKAWAPFLANLALSPLAILAGLLPLTFAGVGTRDAALVLF